MKKLFALCMLAGILFFSASAQAQQGGGDPAAMRQRMIERVRPQLIEKTKLTEAQADKVLDINWEARREMRALRDQNLSEEDRKKKSDEIQAASAKKYKDIPLTDDQIKAVNEFFEEMRRNMRQQNGGGN